MESEPSAGDGGSVSVPALTRAQRRAVEDADPGTGEVRAGDAALAGLAGLGLVRPHGPRGAHYLTARGRALRERLRGRAAPLTAEAPAADDGGYVPACGDGPPCPDPRQRARAAARAWESLLEIRRMTRPPGAAARPAPAPWERARPRHAVALALEAAGTTPSAVDATGRRVRTGYRVTGGPDGSTVRVEWRYAAGVKGASGDVPPGARTDDARERLAECAAVLSACGWEAERYLATGRRPYLLVAPAGPLRGTWC
jgi:hypothetical protein